MEERLIKLNENIGDEQAIINKNEVEEIGYCRTCANGSDYFIPIFKDEGLSHELQSKVEKYLHIKITEMDILPVQLCYQCASTLLAWDTLVQGVQQAEQKLKQLLNQENSVEYKDVELFDTGGNGSIFIDTNDIDSDDEPLSKKQANSTNLQEGGIDCQNSSRKTRMSVVYALSSVKTELVEDSDLPLKKRKKKSVKLRKRNQIYECTVCQNQMTSKEQLSDHMKEHLHPNHLSCEVCGKLFLISKFLVKHLKKVHNKLNFICSICGQHFKNIKQLSEHEELHLDVKKRLCELCGKTFNSKPAYLNHRRMKHSHSQKHFTCEICEKTFTSNVSKHQHLLIHQNSKPVLCPYCGKYFRTRSNLNQHLLTHTNVKKHVCKHCGKGFGRKDHATIHERSHTGEKPYVCNICERAFSQLNDMKKHKKLHKTE